MSPKYLLKFIALGFGLAMSGAVLASPINVLWYTGGTDSDGVGGYQTSINTLAASQGWNVTYWSSGAMPTGAFNVLVIASPEGGWNPYGSYGALNAAVPTFGDREMLTGQDADWHYIFSPGPSAFDGPQGFLADSINWAGNGTGLGLVALGMDGMGTCGGAMLGLTGFSSDCTATNNVQIPGAVAGYPVNAGLTSAGLSNWSTSAHMGFWNLSSAWTAINVDGNNSCAGAASGATCYVTILSAATAGGGTGTVPEPAELGMFGLGLALIGLFAGLRRRAA